MNNKSAREDAAFVKSEVLCLEKLGCVTRVTDRLHIVLPLSSIFSKKKRVVIDASRALNPYLRHRRVRLQDLRDIPNVVRKGMCTDDLDFGEELTFWKNQIEYLNGFHFSPSLSVAAATRLVVVPDKFY